MLRKVEMLKMRAKMNLFIEQFGLYYKLNYICDVIHTQKRISPFTQSEGTPVAKGPAKERPQTPKQMYNR